MKEIKTEANAKKSLLLTNVLSLALAVLIIIFPNASSNIICRGIGMIGVVWGIVRIVIYFTSEKSVYFGSFSLVSGCALSGFGIYFIVKPETLASVLTVFIAVFIVIGGVMKLQYAIDQARLKVGLWWIQLLGAYLMIAFGIVAFFNPFKAAAGLMIFMGIALAVNSIWDIITIICISRLMKRTEIKAEVRDVDEKRE